MEEERIFLEERCFSIHSSKALCSFIEHCINENVKVMNNCYILLVLSFFFILLQLKVLVFVGDRSAIKEEV